ncbi:MAG: hypothetical protein JWO08_3186 [Verrucomicrobiaceae bacterium]|nr:hypothetical protein [Verrucomicrobiaceae bacterium]
MRAIDTLRQLEDQLILLCLPFLEVGIATLLDDEAFISGIKMTALEVRGSLPPLASDHLAEGWSRVEEFILGLTVAEDPRRVLGSSVAVCFVRCSLEAGADVNIEFATQNLRLHPTFRQKIADLCGTSEWRGRFI